MHVGVYHLTLHDYCFYASREMGRLYETEKYLHNYGLSYALGLATSAYASQSRGPHYSEDLQPLNERGIYVTPAYPLRYQFASSTFKMESADYYTFTPQISANLPIYGKAKELAPESEFEFYVLSEHPLVMPHWIRLGKWMAKAQVRLMAQGVARIGEGSVEAVGALNPLDLDFVPDNCTIIAMAPASLLTNVFYTGPYYELGPIETLSSRRIRLPVGMSYQPERAQPARAS
jgi:CRISPR-associated protein Csc1